MLRHFSAKQLAGITAVFLATYAGFFTIFFPVCHRYECLAHIGVRTSGSVIAKEPKNHASVRYDYSVDGSRYEGTLPTGGHIPALDTFKIGQGVAVTYCPEKPWVSVASDPEELYQAYCGLLIAVPLLFGLIAALGVAVNLKGVTLVQLTADLTRR
jgi:hypothetical protein